MNGLELPVFRASEGSECPSKRAGVGDLRCVVSYMGLEVWSDQALPLVSMTACLFVRDGSGPGIFGARLRVEGLGVSGTVLCVFLSLEFIFSGIEGMSSFRV